MDRRRENTMKTRIVHTKVWQDDWFTNLSRSSKILFLYLLTNDQIGLSGKFELTDRRILFDTGLNNQELDQGKIDLKNKIAFFNGWVWIRNTDKYNKQYTASSKNQVALDRENSFIPDSVREYFDSLSIDYPSSMDSTINHKSEIINHKSEIKGGVGGKINQITEDQMLEISDTYQVPLSFVKSKYDDLVNYCKRTGRVYKDYLAALRNFVKQDALKVRKEASINDRKRGIDATAILRTMGGDS